MQASTLTSTITFSDEQSMLLDTAVEFCRNKAPIAAVRAQLVTDRGFEPDVWREMVELGWSGIAIPEAWGGSGLGLAAAVVISEPMGRALFASPFQSTQLAIAGLLHGNDAQKRNWLPRIAEGAIATVALQEPQGSWELTAVQATTRAQDGTLELAGAKTLVQDAAVAELLLVSLRHEGAPALALVEAAQLPAGALQRETILDETRRSYRIDLRGVRIAASQLITGEAALAALTAIHQAGMLLLTAEACGGTAGVLDVLLEYLKTRTQFGRKIGAYQALKHPTVDILIGLERSRSHLYHAASVLDTGEAESALRMAKVESCDTFAFAGDRAIQFHGGFGFTYECDAQLYLRRALWCQSAFGDSLHHRKRLAQLLL